MELEGTPPERPPGAYEAPVVNRNSPRASSRTGEPTRPAANPANMNALLSLEVLQIHTGRSWASHEAALNLAHEHHFDVVLIQEPWVHRDSSRRLTKKHPSYMIFSPVDNWSSRPRVMTYVKKDPRLQAYQLRGPWPSCRDIASIQVLNVYNAPNGSEDAGVALDHIIESYNGRPETPWVVAGDFNLKHPVWQPGARSSGHAAEKLLAWADERNMTLCLPPNSHTRGQNMIDLVWVNEAALSLGTHASVIDDIDPGSDHKPISISVPVPPSSGPPCPEPPLRLGTCDKTAFLAHLQRSIADTSGTIRIAQETPCPANIDRAAISLVESLQLALESACKRAHKVNHGQPWWNGTCRRAHSMFRRSKRHGTPEEIEHAKRVFHNAISSAKRTFWQEKIDQLSDNKDVFAAVRWAHSTSTSQSPPLKDESTGELVNTPDAKKDLLATSLLGRASEEVQDIPMPSPFAPPGTPGIRLPPITYSETERSVTGARSSTLGTDGVTTGILKLAWPVIGREVHDLYSLALEHGWHPSPFRSATLVAIPKPTKRDKSNPRSYRLISLLSVLGKALERLLARRMAWTAITIGLIHPNQFGALPGRSSTDLTTAVTHDIETALAEAKVATLLTLDVRGAFDAVLPGFLIRRLVQQGWPSHLIQWIRSFVTGRTGQVRLDGETGNTFNIPAGLPQGSSISPILFLLFLSPALHTGPTQRANLRYSYADDLGLVAINSSLDENISELQADAETIIRWGRSEGLTFDADKTELIHFSNKNLRDNPDIQLRFAQQRQQISAKRPKEALRWLGVWFDRKLTFRSHVEHLAARANHVTAGIRALSNTVRGAPPVHMRRAVQACVVPILTFGGQTWWQDRTRPSLRNRNKEVQSGRVSATEKLDVALRKSIRSALPAYSTTPVAALHREAAIPPMTMLLDHQADKASIRLRRLDPHHPLALRLRSLNRERWPTRFARLASTYSLTEHINPLTVPPWSATSAPDEDVGYQPGILRGDSANHFLTWRQSRPDTDIFVFSDGSQTTDAEGSVSTGSGWSVQLASGFELTNGAARELNAEVYDSEIRGALKRLKAALSLFSLHRHQSIIVCLDNLEAARSLLHIPPSSSQSCLIQFQELSQQWRERPPAPTGPRQVLVRWVPGHAGIPGNTAADELAKRGSQASPPLSGSVTTQANARRRARYNRHAAFARYWEEEAPDRYHLFGIKTSVRPPELLLPRFTLGKLLAARSAHGDFASYHRRFQHADANCFCSCGQEKAPEHFFLCPLVRYKWPTKTSLRLLLGTSRGLPIFHDFITSTAFFRVTCPH